MIDLAFPKSLAGRLIAGLATALLTAGATPAAAARAAPVPAASDATLRGGLGPANPFLAPGGVGAMHSDSYSSDASPQPGPGTGPVRATLAASGALCATTLLDRRGNVVAYCVDHATGQGQLRLLDPRTLDVVGGHILISRHS